MAHPRVAIRLALLALLAPLTPPPALAVDVVLTLDRSLSMQGNDPNRDSIKGAELFAELLGADDRLGLTTFALQSQRLLPLTTLSDPQTRARISDIIEQVRMEGLRTNFDAALRVAYPLYPRQNPDQRPAQPSERVLVLFSDGHLNLGSEEANQRARAAVTNELVPAFQAAGIRILGVAFSADADLAFLRLLADATGGQAFRADSPADIYDAFVRLFEQTDQPLMAPIVDGEVTVDANVHELKLLVKREAGDGPTQLTDPSGRQLSADAPQPGMDWKSTPYFDRITIQEPEAGAWKVAADNADKKAYIESDLDLRASLPVLAGIDERVAVVAGLTYRGVAIAPGLMKGARFTARVLDASGATQQELELQTNPGDPTDQSYRGTLAFAAPGAYRLQVSAEGQDFQRSKAYFITIVGAERPDPITAPSAAPSAAPNQPADPLPDRTLTDTDSEQGQPPSAQALQRSAALILIFGNLALAGLAGLGFWWWRRRRGQLEPDDDDPDDE